MRGLALTYLVVTFWLAFSTSLHSSEFTFFRVSDNSTIQISDIHISPGPIYFGFTAKTNSQFSGKVRYLFNGIEKTSFEIQINSDAKFYFPNPSQQVIIDQEGEHRFIISHQNDEIEEILLSLSPQLFLEAPMNLGAIKNKSRGKDKPVLIQKSVKIEKKRNSLFLNDATKCLVKLKTDKGVGYGTAFLGGRHILTTRSFMEGASFATAVFASSSEDLNEQAEIYFASKVEMHKALDVAILTVPEYESTCELPAALTRIPNESGLYQVPRSAETFGEYESIDQTGDIGWNLTSRGRGFSTPQISETGKFYAMATYLFESNTAQPILSLYSGLLPQLENYKNNWYDGLTTSEWAEHPLTAPPSGTVLRLSGAENNMEELSPIASGSLQYADKDILYTTYANNDQKGKFHFSLDYDADGRVDKVVHQ